MGDLSRGILLVALASPPQKDVSWESGTPGSESLSWLGERGDFGEGRREWPGTGSSSSGRSLRADFTVVFRGGVGVRRALAGETGVQ